ncbi:MAG TPA: tRNA (adenosine(37)-N6)-dimethylallyltransferase MiaA, partial [Syntrophales bacterium]
GKTGLALDLASAFDGEIISADSMQVYRHLDIGTSKPTRQEQERVHQHLIDIVNPDEEFNAALFHGLADAVIGKLQGEKNIFVAGGTGLYIRTLTGGIIEGPGPDEARRKDYRDALEKEEKEALYGRLRKLDPRAAERIHPHDMVRIVRALETAELSGEPISEKQRRHGFRQVRYEFLKVGLYRDRGELYHRIDSRASQMIEAGLVEETKKILCMGYDDNIKPLQSLGYKYIIRYIRNELTLEEALKLMQRDTRHYARRQMTWFRGEGDIEWFHPDETGPIRLRIDRFLHGR